MGHAYHPVFAAPDCHALQGSSGRPVDLVHLARQTGGDKSLEQEVLHLFLRQANLLTRDLKSHSCTEARRRLAHTLKGTARAVGAFGVADMAADIEQDPSCTNDLSGLEAHVGETCDYISSLLR